MDVPTHGKIDQFPHTRPRLRDHAYETKGDPMGLFGFGKDDDVREMEKDISVTGSALERAKKGDEGGMAGAATRLMERLLDTGIDGRGPLDSAHKIATDALAKRRTTDEAVDEIVKDHTMMAATGGFLTSLGGFITMPVAMPANIVEFYLLATRMVASIAKTRGYDIDKPEIRSAILLTLVGADADDLLKKAGVVATGRLSNLAAQRLPGPILMVVNKAVAFRLLASAGRNTLARFGKGLPVAGGFVGAGLDTYLIRKIADSARREFPPVTDGTVR